VLQVLGALIRKLRAERALQRLHAAVHELVARLDVARGGEPDLLRLRDGGRPRPPQGGGQDARRNPEGLLEGHAHSFDLATNASATSSAAKTSTRNPDRPFFICTGHVCTSRAPAATSACRSGSMYSGLMSSTSVASSATRPASAACSARRIRNALG